MPLSRHIARTYQETSSHTTRQGTLDHSRLSSLSQCGLILALIQPEQGVLASSPDARNTRPCFALTRGLNLVGEHFAGLYAAS